MVVVPFLLIPTLRNVLHFGEFIPLTSAGGKTLWLATVHSDTFGFSGRNQHVLLEHYVEGKPGKTDENFYRASLATITSEPIYYAAGVLKRLYAVNLHAFGEPPVRGRSWPNWLWRLVLRLAKVTLVFGFLIGIVFLWRRQRLAASFIFSIYAYKFLFLHTIFNGTPRMFYPFYAIAVPVAVIGYAHVWDIFGRNDKNQATAAVK